MRGTCHCVSSSAPSSAANTARGGASRGERGWRQAAAGSPSSACWAVLAALALLLVNVRDFFSKP
jgi:hypothetical protein